MVQTYEENQLEEVNRIKDFGYSNNKDVIIKSIKGIYIKKFRSLEKRKIDLGEHITVLSGKNGTMKSTILGLIGHPFSSPNNAKDYYGNELKTSMSQVFRFSKNFDRDDYEYDIIFQTNKDEIIAEPCRVYFSESDNRHRITVSGNAKGQGNLSLNTAFLNLKRLFPIVHTKATTNSSIHFSQNELNTISKAFEKIMFRTAYKNIDAIEDKGVKTTIGPKNSNYDFESISSGEDNLGHILTKLIAFEKYKLSDEQLNGILCIDEFEAGLHPIVQIKLFEYLYNWSKNNNVQIVITTHSLYLLSHILELKEKILNPESIVLNIISTAFTKENNYNIIKNPPYNVAYKELTFKDFNDISEIHKINVICEDEVAKFLIERIIKTQEIKKRLNFITNLSGDSSNEGNSYNVLAAICSNGTLLLSDSIVIFDADVPNKALDKIKNFHDYLRIPDKNNLPVEKTIVRYILELDGNNDFFSHFNKEKEAFISDFTEKDIPLDPSLITSNISPKKYKSWANSCKKEFNKYVTYYVNDNLDLFKSFRNDLINIINAKLANKSLPLIDKN